MYWYLVPGTWYQVPVAPVGSFALLLVNAGKPVLLGTTGKNRVLVLVTGYLVPTYSKLPVANLVAIPGILPASCDICAQTFSYLDHILVDQL